jgi:Mn-dependent DtxR family transcriptional regulator
LEAIESLLLNALAKEFEKQQGMHVEVHALASKLNIEEADIEIALKKLEEQGLVNTYAPRGKVLLSKITWKGLEKVGEVKLKRV